MARATVIATLRATKRWILAWAGAPVLAIVNGAARETLHADAVGDDASHAISTNTLLALLGGYVWLLSAPLGGRREALSVDAAWASMAVAFEFAFGHWVEGDSWSTLLGNYDVTAGKIWILVPAAMFAGHQSSRGGSPPASVTPSGTSGHA